MSRHGLPRRSTKLGDILDQLGRHEQHIVRMVCQPPSVDSRRAANPPDSRR